MNGLNEAVARRLKQGFLLFAIIAAVLLLTEHRAHVLPYLPWLLLLAACPLMHIFMHHEKHGGHTRPSPSQSGREKGNHE